MKTIILFFAIFLVITVAYSHEDSKEYRVECKSAEGCPIVNGTCPTCKIIGRKAITNEELDAKIDRMLEEYKANLKKEYGSNFSEVKRSKRKTSGWERDPVFGKNNW